MLLARLGLGAGEAPTFPVSYRGVRDWAPSTERVVAFWRPIRLRLREERRLPVPGGAAER